MKIPYYYKKALEFIKLKLKLQGKLFEANFIILIMKYHILKKITSIIRLLLASFLN